MHAAQILTSIFSENDVTVSDLIFAVKEDFRLLSLKHDYGLVQRWNFSCTEPNVNELSSLFELICIRFGT